MPLLISRTLAALLTGALASCMPAPHVAHLRPAVSGVVLENGQPVPGIQLFLARYPGNNEPCTAAGEAIPVSREGVFGWPARQERRLTDSLIDPVAMRGSVTVLCMRHPTRGAMIGAVLFMKQAEPVSLQLACDPARPRTGAGSGPHIASTMLGQPQFCNEKTASSTSG